MWLVYKLLCRLAYFCIEIKNECGGQKAHCAAESELSCAICVCNSLTRCILIYYEKDSIYFENHNFVVNVPLIVCIDTECQGVLSPTFQEIASNLNSLMFSSKSSFLIPKAT